MDNGVLFILLTFLSATVGTMTGFGTSTIMVPILSLFLPIPETLLFVGVIHWFGDIWKMIFFKKGINIRLIVLFGVPGIVASFFAAKLPLAVPELLLQRSLGAFLVMYVAFIVLNPKWKIRPSTENAVAGGVLSGFFAGVFGVGGAIRSTFLSAFNLNKSIFIFTSGAIGILVDSARLTQYVSGGIQLSQTLLMSLILCVPTSLLGALLAKRLVERVPQTSFRMVIAIALFLVGLRYLLLT
jgi:hypothetical protein